MIQLALGVDPGYANCGLGIITRSADQRWRCVHSETVRTPPSLSFHERLYAVYRALHEIPIEPFRHVKAYECVIACEEQTGTHEGKRRTGGTRFEALLVQQVVGVVRVYAYEQDYRFVEPTPAQAKKVLGGIKNNATKEQVQRAIRTVILDCPAVMKEHASDALANALAGARMVR
jgi:Holliday junction resolvasome RuvABC endonuclease subunit